MSIEKYLDYAGLQYYHQKLKLELESMVIDNVAGNLTIPNDGFFRIRIGDMCYGCDASTSIPIDWQTNNFILEYGKEYVFPNIITIDDINNYTNSNVDEALYSSGIGGLAVEILGTNELGEYHYYSTIGNGLTESLCRQSKYTTWVSDEIVSYYEHLWNFIDLYAPNGYSKVYNLNYHLNYGGANNYNFDDDIPFNNDLDINSGEFFPSNEFQITLIRNAYNKFSVILYWGATNES